jgi:ABC-type transport system involved in multi-copper enzyme maturation permease subunit
MSDSLPMSAPLPQDESPVTIELDETVATATPVATEVVGDRRRFRRPRLALRDRLRSAFAGFTAIGVKELRGRMRGRRAFVILTVYLVLLATFAWMMELILEQRYGRGLAGSAAFASAQIGAGIFAALLMLETLLVVALAPAFTAGAISLEREKQTLDMLATTPISSLSIVIGKLLSALTYLFILIFASIPMTAIVFVFGGVSPDDVIRGYVILFATAIGLGSVGLFFSALMKRTQAATIATYFGLLFVTLGSFFIFYFWNTMTDGSGTIGQGFGPLRGRPPEALVYLNPYYAQADVLCGVENGFGDWCSQIAYVTDRSMFGGPFEPPILNVPTQPAPGFGSDSGIGNGVINDVVGAQPFGVVRDSFWPRSVISWLVLSAVLLLFSVQLVSPTRRWRPRLPGFLRRSSRRVSA